MENKEDLGTIDFGNTYKGKRWDDPGIRIDWLEYIVKDECLSSEGDKEKARIMLTRRRFHKDQLKLY